MLIVGSPRVKMFVLTRHHTCFKPSKETLEKLSTGMDVNKLASLETMLFSKLRLLAVPLEYRTASIAEQVLMAILNLQQNLWDQALRLRCINIIIKSLTFQFQLKLFSIQTVWQLPYQNVPITPFHSNINLDLQTYHLNPKSCFRY